MAEAKIAQLAKLLSTVMEYEELPVEIHNAIADWSCPSTARVSNGAELFQLISRTLRRIRKTIRKASPKCHNR